MNIEQVQPIVNAVLYEGYILYPYRATATKNRQRWTFGGIYPQAYFEATGGAEPWQMQTQCLIAGSSDTRLEVRVRFLQPVERQVGELPRPLAQWPVSGQPDYRPVAQLTVDGQLFQSWQEAVERDIAVADCPLADLLGPGQRLPFRFQPEREMAPLTDAAAQIHGLVLREVIGLQGQVVVAAQPVADNAFQVSVEIENLTPMDATSIAGREEASLYSFASTHTILGVTGGDFISLMDPPHELEAEAAACVNQGAYPVLVGAPGQRDTMLSSPIILHDYPQVAPESPGDLFDATEIDEILSLNILAMTDDEKREMAAGDPRAAALLARTEALDGDDFMRLHGVLRRPRAAPEPSAGERGDSAAIIVAKEAAQEHHEASNPLEPPPSRGPRLAYYSDGARELKVGDRVRLQPRAGGDVMDIVLAGKTAMIEGVERDFEDRVYVAVTIDDDPGREWGLQRMPGHRFFFSPEEVEPLPQTVGGGGSA